MIVERRWGAGEVSGIWLDEGLWYHPFMLRVDLVCQGRYDLYLAAVAARSLHR
jgi:hypothetical protein